MKIMKMNKTHYSILILLMAIFTTSTGYSQSILQGEPSMEIREMAKDHTDMWVKELALTRKQADLMEIKIIEFAMKKRELLESKMQEEAKAKRLLALQENENRDMRDILTKPQHERYLMVQKQLLDEQLEKEKKKNK